MDRWFNPSQPQTLQAAVFLGYFAAVFGLLSAGGNLLLLPAIIGVGVGAFATANNKRWGYLLLAVCAFLLAALRVFVFVAGAQIGIIPALWALNGCVFPVALAVAVLHRQSRSYQKVWFE
ncbi:MAG: hypothetical protein ACK5RL_08630 [Acidimicrobiales bacterium]